VTVAWNINTAYFSSPLNCPDCADKLSDYLSGAPITAAGQGRRFDISGTFTAAPFGRIIGMLQQQGHGRHAVIRGLRSRPPFHYFVAANIRGTVYVLDAFTREAPIPVTDQQRLQDYLVTRGRFTSFQYSTNFNSTQRP
jgi:hypothetical protein